MRPNLADTSELELVDRLRHGNVEALDELVARYITPLRDFAYLTVRDADLAYDVVQDVFVYLWEHRTTIHNGATLRGYLYRAVRHRALDVLKHERAQAKLRNMAMPYEVASPGSADDRVATDEFLATVQSALETMTPRVREILLMNRIHGMSVAEIAELLELSIPTVKSQLSRALKYLGERIGS